jgi:menaquinone-dependent protoporphyrinogen oxidase
MPQRRCGASLVAITADDPADRPRVLVAFAGKHGATAEIAEAIADELRGAGLDVECRPAGDVKHVNGYDAVVLGSAVYMKRWQHEARRLLHKHRDELAARALWIFSSGPFGEHPDPAWAEPPKIVDEAQKLGVRDHAVFGGRLPTEPKGFIEKAMVRDTPPDVADLRDRDEIRRWAHAIAGEVLALRMSTGRLEG